MKTTAVQGRRRIAILASLLLVVAFLATIPGFVRPQVARASVASGDVIFTRVGFSDCPGITQIAQYNGSTETDLSDCTASDQMPAVSPDGSRIVFQSEGSDPTLDGLYVMNADGSGRTQVTEDCLDYSAPYCGTTYTDENPSWSPDGTQIVFTRQTSSGLEIDTINADGSGLTTLVSVGSGGYVFTGGPTSWSPDGTEILYTLLTGGSYDLYQVNPSTDTQSLVLDASTAGYDFDPVWSPDGTRIYFDNGSDVFGFTYSDSSDIKQLIDSGGYEPTVSPDGSTVTYAQSGYLYTVSSTASMATGASLTTDYHGDNEPAYSLGSFPSSTASSVSISSLSATVTSTTPLYDLTVSMNLSGISCPAFVIVKYGTTSQDKQLCWSGGTAPSSATTNISVLPLDPETSYTLSAQVQDANGTSDAETTSVTTPKVPVWVAAGDSFSSGWHQSSDDLCTDYFSEDCGSIDAATDLTVYDSSYAWPSQSASDLMTALSVPARWQMVVENIAVGGANAEDFSRTLTSGCGGCGQQDELAAYLSDHSGSWNIVTMDGGANDIGLEGALHDFYVGNFDAKPWDLGSGSRSLCPNTDTLDSNVSSDGASIYGALSEMAGAAYTADPNVRVLALQYPYILDSSNVCAGYSSGTAPHIGATQVIDDLDSALSTLALDDGVKLVDLRDAGAFATDPISLIQQTRYYGFPHPNSDGQAQIATSVEQALVG